MTESHITAQDLYKIVSLSDPRFSPDGKWLAYVRTEMDRESNSYKSAIWLAPTDGGRPRQFTNGDKKDNTPRWSPDGRWLVFVSNRGDDKAKAQLYLIPTDGGEARPLTRMENGASEPVWSLDGKRLAFISRLNAEEMATEDESEPEPSSDPDEAKRRAEEKEKKEKEKADPRVIDSFAYRAETRFFDGRTKHLYVVEVDLETGKTDGRPHRLTSDGRDYSDPRWMPYGQGLVAMVNR
jgi:Tol biopolymer transport system component